MEKPNNVVELKKNERVEKTNQIVQGTIIVPLKAWYNDKKGDNK